MAVATRARIWLGARRRGTRLEAPAGVSGRLAEFVAELPHERGPIVAFVRRAAASIPAGSRVLDAGAGDAPYRELFRHVDYVTADWPNSVHEGAQQSDVVASLDDLPLDDAAFDAVVCTQVLEHLEEPLTVLRELARVSKPGATLWITVPLVWPIHEAPFDFFRYTPYSLASLLTRSGFADVDVRARNGSLATLAQLMHTADHLVGYADDGHDRERRKVVRRLKRLARRLDGLDHLDTARIFPLGYEVRAVRAGAE